MTVRVGDCSEARILAAFTPLLASHNQRAAASARVLVAGPGDDAAVLDLSGGLTVITTDTQTQDQDFRLTWPSGAVTTGYDVGFKACTQNLADVASMGAVPTSMVVSLSLPPDTPLDFVTSFAQGLVDACTSLGAPGCTIAGGDLGRSREISVTVTALGLTTQPVYRSGAKPGNVLAVAGELGTAAAGFEVLERAQPLPEAPSALICVAAQQRPTSPLSLGAQAAGIATAMMDISDGPLKDAERIAQASKVSLNFESKRLTPWIEPLLQVAQYFTNEPAQLAKRWVLTGGENHGLLAAFSRVEDIPEGFVQVGTCLAYDEHNPVTVDGASYEQKGWDHFE